MKISIKTFYSLEITSRKIDLFRITLTFLILEFYKCHIRILFYVDLFDGCYFRTIVNK